MATDLDSEPDDEILGAAFNAWFLRRDQAQVLADALDEVVPDGTDGDVYMRSAARSKDGPSAKGWSVVFDTDLEHHTREVGRDFLDRLDVVETEHAPIFAADMRHLGTDGRPAGRNEPCRCGSGRKAKKCQHLGVPMIFGTTWLIKGQPEWGAFLAAMGQDRWDSAPEMIPYDMYRIAMSFGTLDGLTLITTTLDAPLETDPNYACDTAESSLAETITRLLPFLSDSHMHLTAVMTDKNPGATSA